MLKQIIILALLPLALFGQGLTEKYVSFDIGWGQSSLSTTYNNVSLAFTENSFRELPFSFERNIGEAGSYNRVLLQLKFGRYKGLSHSIYFDGSISDHGKGRFGYSIGYNYPIEIGIYDLLLRGSLGISNGEASYDIGEIAVDTIGIVIDDTDYIDTDVNIYLSSRTTYLTPKLEVTFLIAQKFGIWAALSYDHTISKGDQVTRFAASKGDWKDTKLNFDSDFYDFKVDGAAPADRLFDTNGVGFSVGLSSYFNRD